MFPAMAGPAEGANVPKAFEFVPGAARYIGCITGKLDTPLTEEREAARGAGRASGWLFVNWMAPLRVRYRSIGAWKDDSTPLAGPRNARTSGDPVGTLVRP